MIHEKGKEAPVRFHQGHQYKHGVEGRGGPMSYSDHCLGFGCDPVGLGEKSFLNRVLTYAITEFGRVLCIVIQGLF